MIAEIWMEVEPHSKICWGLKADRCSCREGNIVPFAWQVYLMLGISGQRYAMWGMKEALQESVFDLRSGR